MPAPEPPYQTAWEAFTGLFDPRRWGKPPPLNATPEEDKRNPNVLADRRIDRGGKRGKGDE